MGRLIRLCAVTDEFKATLIQQRLEQEGIHVHLVGVHGNTYMIENMDRAIQLMISESELAQSQQILKNEFDYSFDLEPPKNFWDALKKAVTDFFG